MTTLNKLLMDVYVFNHSDGTPRKYWCHAVVNGETVTRYGAASARLQESVTSLKSSVVDEKLNKGYVYDGQFWVSDKIDRNTSTTQASQQVPQQAHQPVGVTQPTPQPRFQDGIVFWSATSLFKGWLPTVLKTLSSIDGVKLTAVEGDKPSLKVEIGNQKILLKTDKSTGIIKADSGDFQAGILLLYLAKQLPIKLTDDATNLLDRNSLKALFVKSGRSFKVTDGQDEYDAFSSTTGLTAKIEPGFFKRNPMFASTF
jgi:hypothetical protein